MSKPGTLTAKDAIKAIEGILAALPASELPKVKLEEDPDGRILAWVGSVGHELGSATRRTLGVDIREPLIYRERAASDALAAEAVCRADFKHLATKEATR